MLRADRLGRRSTRRPDHPVKIFYANVFLYKYYSGRMISKTKFNSLTVSQVPTIKLKINSNYYRVNSVKSSWETNEVRSLYRLH